MKNFYLMVLLNFFTYGMLKFDQHKFVKPIQMPIADINVTEKKIYEVFVPVLF